jgi:hypothetical protein
MLLETLGALETISGGISDEKCLSERKPYYNPERQGKSRELMTQICINLNPLTIPRKVDSA